MRLGIIVCIAMTFLLVATTAVIWDSRSGVAFVRVYFPHDLELDTPVYKRQKGFAYAELEEGRHVLVFRRGSERLFCVVSLIGSGDHVLQINMSDLGVIAAAREESHLPADAGLDR